MLKRALRSLCVLISAIPAAILAAESSQPKIAYRGQFMTDTRIPGEGKTDWVQPSYPTFVQLSCDRYLILFQTRGFGGIDNERAICYQIRADRPNGPVLKEKVLSPYTPKWRPLEDGPTFYKQQGTPMGFGVPAGVRIGDRKLPHANVFVVHWYNAARELPAEDGTVTNPRGSGHPLLHVHRIEWAQVRYGREQDDIELIEQPRWLRQRGCEEGDTFTSLEGRIHSVFFWSVQPWNEDRSKWIAMAVFNRAFLAPILFEFNREIGRYEWTRTGAPVRAAGIKLTEPSLCKVDDTWIVAARTNVRFREGHPGSCTAWFRSTDPMAGFSQVHLAEVPSTWGPRLAYTCPDGVLRIFSGELSQSPYHQKRNPLYCWDVDPDTFAVSNRRIVLDANKSGLSLRHPMIGFARLSPLYDGNRQVLAFRVTTQNHRHATDRFPAVTEDELAVCGSHYCEIEWEGTVQQGPWTFGE